MNLEQQFKDRLRAVGERVTAPRLGVYRILLRQGPLAMPRLILKASEDGIDRVTTYRTVNLLLELGFIQEFGLGRHRLLEVASDHDDHHHHFTCMQCGKLSDFDSVAIEEELDKIGTRLGFRTQSHQVEVKGLCLACQRLKSH